MYTTEVVTLGTLFQVIMCLEAFSIDNNSWKTQRLKGRFTRDVNNYEVTVPCKLSSEGTFLSHSLPHFYKRDINRVRGRRYTEGMSDLVHYGVGIRGQDYVVELRPNRGLMSPSLMVEKRSGGSLQDTNIHPASSEQCHYTGWIRGNRNTTRAAISVCHPGMVGYVKTSDGRRHFIEPVADHQPESDGRHLHMVYEDSQDFRHKRNCGTGDDWESAWRERLTRERRHCAKTERGLRRDVERRLDHVREALRHPQDRRAVHSEHRYLEILVVADKRFIEYHDSSDLESYILTVMNMANDFYHDASVGNLIDFVVVRIMYLEKEEKEIDLIINRDADATLASFCNWQLKVNPRDISHPNHHDIAVLLTRYDICSDNMTECSLLGLAYMAEACNTNMSCCINEDSGLTLGVVVTHEVGHVLGCAHDESDVSCKPFSDPEKKFAHVMSPYVQLATNKWSTCSRSFMTEFLDNNLGTCLLDEPQDHSFKLPSMPPGAMYDIEWQCRQKFGPNSKSCKRGPAETCEKLWCTLRGTDECGTYGNPPADGTKCGENMWCFERQCVDIGARPAAVDGGWAEWGPFSECSRSCGGGVSIGDRDCTNPVPQNHGRYCTGEKRRYRICNTSPCDMEKPSFRASQCAEYNKQPFKDQLHQWKPHYSGPDLVCQLICINEKNDIRVLAPRAADGTPCRPGTKDLCIAGTCRKVGCDWVIDSDAVEDQCGVCKGDGTGCKFVEDTFTMQTGNGYEKITTIPAEATKIFVEEVKPSPNTIAVTDESGNNFYLNGDFIEESDGELRVAGAVSVYSHPEPDREMLFINGPLGNNINLYLCFFEDENPGVTYKYAIPALAGQAIGAELPIFTPASDEKSEQEIPVFTSPLPDLGDISGVQIPVFTSSVPQPEQNIFTETAEPEIPTFSLSIPELNINSQKKPSKKPGAAAELGSVKTAPASGIRSQQKSSEIVVEGQASGTEHPPKYSWEFLEWGECSVKCGAGVQMSDPSCVEERSGRVSNFYCEKLQKPEPMARICNFGPCTAHWKIGAWSHCQGCLYQTGCRTRSVKCVKQSPAQDLEVVTEDKECPGKKPATKELCTPVQKCQKNHSQAHKTSHKTAPAANSAKSNTKLKANEKASHLSSTPEENTYIKEGSAVNTPAEVDHKGSALSYKSKPKETSKLLNKNGNALNFREQPSKNKPKRVNDGVENDYQTVLDYSNKEKDNAPESITLHSDISAETEQNYAENINDIPKHHRTILNVVSQQDSGKGAQHRNRLLDAELTAYKWKLFRQPPKISAAQHRLAERSNTGMETTRRAKHSHAISRSVNRRTKNSVCHHDREFRRRVAQVPKQRCSKRGLRSANRANKHYWNKLHHHQEQIKSLPSTNVEAQSLKMVNEEDAQVISNKALDGESKRGTNKELMHAHGQKRRSPFEIKTVHDNKVYSPKKEWIEEQKSPKVAINKTNIGKIVKDTVPEREFELEEAPMIEETKQLVLSDEASEILGDKVPDIINTNNATYLKGKQAEELEKRLIHGEKKWKTKT